VSVSAEYRLTATASFKKALSFRKANGKGPKGLRGSFTP